MVRLLVLLISCCYAVTACAQGSPLPDGTTVVVQSFNSTLLDQERQLYVSLPPGYDTMTQPLPVIYVLDGESRFNVSQGIIAYSRYSAMLPPAIVVGLPNRSREERTRFYLPEEGSFPNQFLAHLATEVLPFVERTYRTGGGDRYLIGHSHGAVFTLYALLHRPELFRGYLASDPSVKFLIEPAAELLREQYEGQRLFLSSTDVAYGYAEDVRDDIHSDQATFVALLRQRAPAGLELATDHIADDHGNGYVAGLSLGLRYLFFGWQRPAALAAEATD